MASLMRDRLVLETRHGAVLVLTFNRPDRLNAWNDGLEDTYFAALEAADADESVRAVVITGAGRGFCAGADMADVSEVAEHGDGSEVLARPHPRSYPLQMRKPLIAAINGPAAGLGLVEALYCDTRFCAEGAKLTTSFARRGLIAEYGISWLLPRLIGVGRALDLLLSARVVLADEALRIGLVDQVVPADAVLEAAISYATELATFCAPTSMAIIKRQVYDDLGGSFAEAVQRADQLLLESLAGADVSEGVASYVERRPPAFAPLAAQGG